MKALLCIKSGWFCTLCIDLAAEPIIRSSIFDFKRMAENMKKLQVLYITAFFAACLGAISGDGGDKAGSIV